MFGLCEEVANGTGDWEDFVDGEFADESEVVAVDAACGVGFEECGVFKVEDGFLGGVGEAFGCEVGGDLVGFYLG